MRLFIHELRGELRLYSRSRELAFFTFLLPLILFVLLGFAYGRRGDPRRHAAPTTCSPGRSATASSRRPSPGWRSCSSSGARNGILKRLRATPLPAPAYLVAVLITTLIAFLGHGRLPRRARHDRSSARRSRSHPGSLVLTLLLGGASLRGARRLHDRVHAPCGGSLGGRQRDLPSGRCSSRARSSRSSISRRFLQTVADVLPLTYFIDLVGDVMLKGDQIWERARRTWP